MKEIYDYCETNAIVGEDNCVWYGDADVYVWIEPNEGSKKVLILRNVVTCADEGIYVFTLDEFGALDSAVDDGFLDKFTCRAVASIDEDTPSPTSFEWGDFRDTHLPSLKTLRENNWRFGYNDSRDRGHMFAMKHNRLDNSALYSAGYIKRSLMELDYAYDNIVTRQDYQK